MPFAFCIVTVRSIQENTRKLSDLKENLIFVKSMMVKQSNVAAILMVILCYFRPSVIQGLR